MDNKTTPTFSITPSNEDPHLPVEDGPPSVAEHGDLRRQAARLLGQARTEAKARAARENGRRGGWPKGRAVSEETRRKISLTKRNQSRSMGTLPQAEDQKNKA